MLVTRSLNRRESWEYENCENFVGGEPEICPTTYWAYPDGLWKHVDMREQRRVDVEWIDDEVDEYDTFAQQADHLRLTVAEAIKRVAKAELNRRRAD